MSQTVTKTGIVYVLTNAAMVGYVKIGQTGGTSVSDVRRRMSQLDSTGVPRAFQCEYAAVVEDHEYVEKVLHTIFGDFRVRENREFFEGVAPFRVKAAIELRGIVKDVTPGKADPEDGAFVELDTVVEKAPRTERFRFASFGVPIGAELLYVDDPAVRCIVVDGNNHVERNGTTYTISGLARELKGWPSARGSLYWLYEGETLQERRDRMDSSEDGDT